LASSHPLRGCFTFACTPGAGKSLVDYLPYKSSLHKRGRGGVVIRPFLLHLSTSSIINRPSAIDTRPFQNAACFSYRQVVSVPWNSPVMHLTCIFPKQNGAIHRIPHKEEPTFYSKVFHLLTCKLRWFQCPIIFCKFTSANLNSLTNLLMNQIQVPCLDIFSNN